MVSTYHTCIIHPLVERCLGWFCFAAIVKRALVNMAKKNISGVGICQGVVWHLVVLFLAFWEWFPEWLNQFAVPLTVKSCPLFSPPLQHFVLIVLFFANLTEVRRNLKVVLVFISLILGTVNFFFLSYFLVTFIPSFENSLFRSVACFVVACF